MADSVTGRPRALQEDPPDPQRILRALPDSEHEKFLAVYRKALDSARDPAGWPHLLQVLRTWQRTASEARQPRWERDTPVDTAPLARDQHAYLQVADRIAARIRAGEFGATGKLPSEAQLRGHYSVGSGVIRHARQELMRRGLVAVDPDNRGVGTFIT